MALISSEAALRQRCLEITPDGSLFASLAARSIRTFRQLAFAIGTPRSEPSQEQYQQLATQLFGAARPLGRVAQLRDLHFEATTYVIQALKSGEFSGAPTSPKPPGTHPPEPLRGPPDPLEVPPPPRAQMWLLLLFLLLLL